jgi:hypothetical protein
MDRRNLHRVGDMVRGTYQDTPPLLDHSAGGFLLVPGILGVAELVTDPTWWLFGDNRVIRAVCRAEASER